jgi:hypothetical protein
MASRRRLLLLFLAFLITLPAVTTRLYASDEIEYFAWLRSVVFDRDADFQNEYQHFYDAGVSHTADFHETFLERTTEIGRRVNYATAGAALLWAPFYAIGHVVALATGAPANGFSQPYIAAVACGSAFYAFLAVLLSATAARRLFGHGLAASLAIAGGTPLIFYAYVAPGFGHAASAFAVSLFVWVWLRVRDRWSIGGAVALGLSGGLLAFVREQDVLLVVGPALDFVRYWVRPSSDSGAQSRPATTQPWVAAIAGTLAFLVALAPLLASYYAVNGHLGATETAARKMNWAAPHALSVLFDLEHGLFAWTPLALVAIVGLVVMWRRNTAPDIRWIGGLMLLMVAAQAYSSGCVESWTVAGSFGQRRFVAITPLLIVGLAALFTHVRATWPRRSLLAVVALCVWWNLGLIAQFGLNRMDRQKLTLMDNARVTFLELPLQAPALAWRYLTDRSSFYKLPRQ